MRKLPILSSHPTKRQLERLSIDDLVELAKRKRSIRYPFKKALVSYLLKVYK